MLACVVVGVVTGAFSSALSLWVINIVASWNADAYLKRQREDRA